MSENTDNIRHANSGEIWKYSLFAVKDGTPLWREVKIEEISGDNVKVRNKKSLTEFNDKV